MSPSSKNLGRNLTISIPAVGAVSLIARAFGGGVQSESIAFVLVLAMGIGVLGWLLFKGHTYARWILVIPLFVVGFFFFTMAVLFSFTSLQTDRFWLNFVVGVANLIAVSVPIGSEAVGDFIWSRDAKRCQQSRWSETPPEPVERRRLSDTAESHLRRAWRRIAFSRLVLVVMFAAWVLATVGMFMGFSRAVTETEDTMLRAEQESGPLGRLGASLAIAMLLVYIPPAGYFFYFVFPFVLCSPMTVPFCLLWKRPGRFLLLRPSTTTG